MAELTLRDIYTLEEALTELTDLAVRYERRLVFKGRDAQQARSAARALGRAQTILHDQKDYVRTKSASPNPAGLS